MRMYDQRLPAQTIHRGQIAALLLFMGFVVVYHLAYTVPVSAQSAAQTVQNSTQSKAAEDDELIDADRPGLADGSTVVGAKRFQLESGIQTEFRRNGAERDHAFFIPTLLRIGIDKRFEARVEANTFTRTTTSDADVQTNRASGLAPVSIGLKYHIEDSKGVTRPSVGAIFRVFPASGTNGFHTDHVTGDLRLVADWDFAPHLSLNPNIGIGRFEADRGKTFTSALIALTLNYLPSKHFNPFVDMGLQRPEESDGKSSVIFDTGVAYIIGRNVQLDVSAGTGAHGNTPPHPFIGFGVSFRTRVGGARKP
jgi:Putative MetA-pathway of phenol degradation